jgi:hypothetical protein
MDKKLYKTMTNDELLQGLIESSKSRAFSASRFGRTHYDQQIDDHVSEIIARMQPSPIVQAMKEDVGTILLNKNRVMWYGSYGKRWHVDDKHSGNNILSTANEQAAIDTLLKE